jgi:serine phosphatase RsbU (regulator of sigma subunit)
VCSPAKAATVQEILRIDNYHYNHLGLPFAIASGLLVALLLFQAFMRGAPLLRGTFGLICAAITPYVFGYALIAWTDRPELARVIARYALAPVPIAGAAVLLFALALCRVFHRHRRLAAVSLGTALVSAVLCATTDLVVSGTWVTPSGITYHVAGPLGAPHTAVAGLWVAVGLAILGQHMRNATDPLRRRQLRAAVWSFSIALLTVVDGLLAYRIGFAPLSWLFMSAAALVATRVVVRDDLARTASLDPNSVRLILYVAAAAAGMWLVVDSPIGAAPPVLVAAAALALFTGLRLLTAVAGRLWPPRRGSTDRVREQAFAALERRLRSATTDAEVAAASCEMLERTLGAGRVELYLPSRVDYSWASADGTVLPEAKTPDPRLLGWLADNPAPIIRDGLRPTRLAEPRALLDGLIEAFASEALIPVISSDEVIGLIAVAELPRDRPLAPDDISLLRRLQAEVTSGLLYARMYAETAAKVHAAVELELAAAVQEAFIPGSKTVRHGPTRLCGLSAPANECGGDWWAFRALADDRLLVLVADVTGHGIASAMVTGAAKGCYEVALRAMGNEVDLVGLFRLLHNAVGRAGGGAFHMTCFACILDPPRASVSFVNAGHVAPYVCQLASDGQVELGVLVARGNPLGSGDLQEYRLHQRPLAGGATVVWYTDGLVESTNREAEQFGDRRFQRALRSIARAGTSVESVRDQLLLRFVQFQDSHPPQDDVTLVVANVAPAPQAATAGPS